MWSAIAACGGAFGLLLGGLLTDLLSLGVGVLRQRPGRHRHRACSRSATCRSPRPRSGPTSLDLAGAISVTAGLIVLVYAIVKAETNGWGSATTLVLAAVAFALLVAFVFIERRHPAPLIRLGIFRIRSLSVANGVMLLAAGGLFAFFFFSTLYVQLILGYSPLEAGLAFLPVAIGIGIGAGLARPARQADRRALDDRRRHGHGGVRPLALLARARGRRRT